MATWYREHGYQFLILTDHNYLTGVAGLNETLGAAEKFLLIPGEEVSDNFEKRPDHVNAFNLGQALLPRKGASMAESIQNNITDIRQARALPSLNHPNFHWAISVEDMLAVSGLTHFEIYNGHPEVNNEGGGGARFPRPDVGCVVDRGPPGARHRGGRCTLLQEVRQAVLQSGTGLGVGADRFADPGVDHARAGEWRFLRFHGVKLKDVQAGSGELALEIDRADWEKTSTFFIGAGGKILATSYDKNPRYRLAAGESYVRARVDSSTGMKAWTQAVFSR